MVRLITSMKKILYPTLTILLCLMAIACHNDKNQQFATPSMKVDLFVVATDSNAVSHNYVGKVLAASDIPLSFALGGQLTSINVTNGQHVSKGQIIATVDNTQQKNMLESCNALLRQAQDGYARVEKVHEKGGVSDVKWVDIQTQLAKAQSAAQSAQKNFDDCTLRATMSGVVNLEDVHVGQRLLPGESLGTLLGNGSMRAEFTVPETDVANIDKGDILDVEIPAIHRSFQARVVEKNSISTYLAHSYTVRADIPQKDCSDLLQGMVCKVRSNKSQSDKQAPIPIVIPVRSLQVQTYGYTVWLVRKGIVHKQQVVLGEYVKEGVIIKSGLSQGDTIVCGGAQKLVEGEIVK